MTNDYNFGMLICCQLTTIRITYVAKCWSLVTSSTSTRRGQPIDGNVSATIITVTRLAEVAQLDQNVCLSRVRQKFWQTTVYLHFNGAWRLALCRFPHHRHLLRNRLRHSTRSVCFWTSHSVPLWRFLASPLLPLPPGLVCSNSGMLSQVAHESCVTPSSSLVPLTETESGHSSQGYRSFHIVQVEVVAVRGAATDDAYIHQLLSVSDQQIAGNALVG